jgi:hypothetical protein
LVGRQIGAAAAGAEVAELLDPEARAGKSV